MCKRWPGQNRYSQPARAICLPFTARLKDILFSLGKERFFYGEFTGCTNITTCWGKLEAMDGGMLALTRLRGTDVPEGISCLGMGMVLSVLGC